METINDVPILLRREIEALMVAPFLEEFAEEIGWEKTREIVRRVVSRLARHHGETLAERAGENSLENLGNILVNDFGKGGALETRVLESDSSCFRMDVVACQYAQMYERNGLSELGSLLSCERDHYMVEGFNPKLELERSETIMGGGSRCDFCLKAKGE